MRSFKLLGLVISLLLILSCEKNSDKLSADFTFDPSSGSTGTIFNFDASSSKNVSEYRWDFNNDGIWDENYSTDGTISYQFTESGSISVKLEVLGEGGITASVTKSISVVLGSGPTITKKFFIQTLVNGYKWDTVENDDPEFYSGFESITVKMAPYFVTFDFNSEMTEAKILDLQGKTLAFDDSGVNIRILKSVKIGEDFTTEDAPDQNGSEFKILNVISDGEYMGYPSYIVNGTFNCKLGDETNSSYIELTEGKFAFRIFDDNL